MGSSTEQEVQDKYKAAERELKQDLLAKYFSFKNLAETGEACLDLRSFEVSNFTFESLGNMYFSLLVHDPNNLCF
jgi:hypothetical protein